VCGLWLQAEAVDPGFKFGLAISDQFANDNPGPFYDDVQSVKTATFGVLTSIPLGAWRCVPTLSYVQKGGDGGYFEYQYSGDWSRYIASADLWYVSLQGDLHLTFPVGNASFYVLASPRVDVLVASTSTGLVHATSGASWVEDTPYRSVVWGAALGIGQDIQLGRHTLFLEARYDRDLSPALELDSYTDTGSPAQCVYNRTFLLQVGFRLNERPPGRQPEETGVWPPANPPR
jgi:hypothetical protein